MKNYTIEINYMTGEVDSFNIKSNNIEWSMEQYQRNRKPFSWKIISEEETK